MLKFTGFFEYSETSGVFVGSLVDDAGVEIVHMTSRNFVKASEALREAFSLPVEKESSEENEFDDGTMEET